jgi:hypothetical protein
MKTPAHSSDKLLQLQHLWRPHNGHHKRLFPPGLKKKSSDDFRFPLCRVANMAARVYSPRPLHVSGADMPAASIATETGMRDNNGQAQNGPQRRAKPG